MTLCHILPERRGWVNSIPLDIQWARKPFYFVIDIKLVFAFIYRCGTVYIYIYIYIYIYVCVCVCIVIVKLYWQYGVPWPSLAIHPNHPLLGLLDCILYLHVADVSLWTNMFMCTNPREVAYEFIVAFPAVLHMSKLSYFSGL